MRRDGIAESLFAEDEQLVDHAAQDASQPLVMREGEDQRAKAKGGGMPKVQGHAFELRTDQEPVEEGAVKNLLERWYDAGRTHEAHHHEEPGEQRAVAELREGIPEFDRLFSLLRKNVLKSNFRVNKLLPVTTFY